MSIRVSLKSALITGASESTTKHGERVASVDLLTFGINSESEVGGNEAPKMLLHRNSAERQMEKMVGRTHEVTARKGEKNHN